MAATVTTHHANIGRVVVLNTNEDSALASLLHDLQDPKVLEALSGIGVYLGVNQREEIGKLWGQLYGGGKSIPV